MGNIENIENIKFLYKMVIGKVKFIEELSLIFKVSKKTIRSHWFNEHANWNIPQKHAAELTKILQNKINNQLNGQT